jgi:hypothetical protein
MWAQKTRSRMLFLFEHNFFSENTRKGLRPESFLVTAGHEIDYFNVVTKLIEILLFSFFPFSFFHFINGRFRVFWQVSI